MHSNGHGLFQLNVQHSPVVSNPVYVVRISMRVIQERAWLAPDYKIYDVGLGFAKMFRQR